jgi:protease I
MTTKPDGRLDGKRIAILATDGVEEVELVEPRWALERAGAATELISLEPGSIQGFNHLDVAGRHEVDHVIADVDESDYDALMIPGGVANPDRLRMEEQVVDFVRAFHAAGKPMAVICHGPWLLVEAGLVAERKLTSWPSLRTDIRNAGGSWVNAEVVADEGLVTSRKPDDIPAFNERMIEEFAVGVRDRRLPREAGALR